MGEPGCGIRQHGEMPQTTCGWRNLPIVTIAQDLRRCHRKGETPVQFSSVGKVLCKERPHAFYSVLVRFLVVLNPKGAAVRAFD